VVLAIVLTVKVRKQRVSRLPWRTDYNKLWISTTVLKLKIFQWKIIHIYIYIYILLGVPLIQWLRLALSKGPNKVGFSLPLTWRRKQIQFPKCSLKFFRIPEDGQSP
jgi:cytochrome b561